MYSFHKIGNIKIHVKVNNLIDSKLAIKTLLTDH